MDVLAAFAVFKAYRAAADNAANALVILQAHAKNADITDIQLARILELPQNNLYGLAADASAPATFSYGWRLNNQEPKKRRCYRPLALA